jgi:hypothetical protein
MEGRGRALRLAVLAAGRRLLLLDAAIDPAGPPRAEIGRRILGKEKRKRKEVDCLPKKEREQEKKSRLAHTLSFLLDLFLLLVPLGLSRFFCFAAPGKGSLPDQRKRGSPSFIGFCYS